MSPSFIKVSRGAAVVTVFAGIGMGNGPECIGSIPLMLSVILVFRFHDYVPRSKKRQLLAMCRNFTFNTRPGNEFHPELRDLRTDTS